MKTATTPIATEPTTFTTPHEQKKTTEQTKPAAKATKKKTSKKKEGKVKETKPAGRDAFGGRIGSRMSKINMCVIDAGKKGITVPEVAAKTKESASIVSAQLGWAVSHLKVATRKEEENKDGKRVYRYFAKTS